MMKYLLVLLFASVAFAQQSGAIGTDIAIPTANTAATVTITSTNEQVQIAADHVGTSTSLNLAAEIANLPAVPTGYTVLFQYSATYTTTLATPPATITPTSFETRTVPLTTGETRVILLWNPTTSNWVEIGRNEATTDPVALTTTGFTWWRQGTTAVYRGNAVVARANFASNTVGRYFTCNVATGSTATDCALGGGAVRATATTSASSAQTVTFIVNEGATETPFANGNVIGKFMGTWVQIIGNNVAVTLIGTVAQAAFTDITAPAAANPAYVLGGFARFDSQIQADRTIGGYWFREAATALTVTPETGTVTSFDLASSGLGQGTYALIHEYAEGASVGANVALNAAQDYTAATFQMAGWNGAADTNPSRSYQANFAEANAVTVNAVTTAVAAASGVTFGNIITTLAFDPAGNAPVATAAPQMPLLRIAPGTAQTDFIVASNALNAATRIRAFFQATGASTSTPVAVSRRPDGTVLVRALAAGTYQLGTQTTNPDVTVAPASGTATFVLPANGVETNLIYGATGFRLNKFICRDGGNTVSVTVTDLQASDFTNRQLASFEFLDGNFRRIVTTCNSFTTDVVGTYTAEQLGTRQANTVTWARYGATTDTASTAVTSTRDEPNRTVTAAGVNGFSSWALAAQAAAGGNNNNNGGGGGATPSATPAVPGVPSAPNNGAMLTAPFMALLAIVATFFF